MLARNLEEALKSSPEIRKVEKRLNYLAVEFKKTGITEYWKIADGPDRKVRAFDIPPNPLNPNKPKLVKQFEANPFYQDEYAILKDHFCIQQSSLKEAGFVNTRFMAHNLTHALYTQGWRDLCYTTDILDRDFEQLVNAPDKHKASKIRFEVHRDHYLGRRLLYHYTPIARGAMPAWDSMSRINSAINKIIAGGTRNLSRENIVSALNKISITPISYHRSYLSECFEDMSGLKVLDLYPTSGSRGLAVMLCGGSYFQVKKMFEGPLKEIASRYKLPEPMIDNGTHHDIVFLSRDRPVKRELVEERISKYGYMADQAVIMIEKQDRDHFVKRFKTSRVLRVSCGITETANEDNYLLIIDQR